MAWAGLRERGHQAGLSGTAAPAAAGPGRRLLVLCAWTAFVVAGIGFAKLAEHFGRAVPARARPVSVGAFGTVQVLAVIGGLLVLAGAAAAGRRSSGSCGPAGGGRSAAMCLAQRARSSWRPRPWPG